jgi:Polysaccharide pyruvyl transferase
MNSDSRISYWLKGQPIQNFGDMLSEALFEGLKRKGLFNWIQGRMIGDYDVVHLIGSCISDYHIAKDLEYVRGAGGRRIAFWGCGLRSNEQLRPDLMAHCAFLGVRGPLTRDVLGLPKHLALGDPGLLMPYVYTPTPCEAFANKTICVPHFLEKQSDDDLLAMSGCQVILRPNLPSGVESIRRFIDALISARFILAGALHAAIVACAYRRPFAYFDSGYIDVPFKWADFAASLAMPCRFAKTVEEGAHAFQLQSIECKIPPLTDLLSCAPYRPPKLLLRKVAAMNSGRATVALTGATS